MPQNHGPASDPVAGQYERWPYPGAIDDLSAAPFDSPDMRFKDVERLYWMYWPDRERRDDMEMLVAGCGTLAAAAMAYLYPRSRVVGIDVSATSLEHERRLKERHGLANLSVHLCPLEQVASLGMTFDYIGCHGVLHHLSDPVAGLRALGGVLRSHGVVSIMVYGRYGRAPVYTFQELFRLLGLGQSEADVRMVKEALSFLGPRHALRRYLELATDLHNEAGLVDTFLHARDRPFSVTECLSLVEDAGLAFGGWEENILYHPDAQMARGSELRARIESLPPPRMWQAMELFRSNIGMHWFFACRRDRPAASYAVRFDDGKFLDYIPVPRISESRQAADGRISIRREPFPALTLGPQQSAIFRQIDGACTVRQCIARATGLKDDPVAIARGLFSTLWRVGYMLYRFPPEST